MHSPDKLSQPALAALVVKTTAALLILFFPRSVGGTGSHAGGAGGGKNSRNILEGIVSRHTYMKVARAQYVYLCKHKLKIINSVNR